MVRMLAKINIILSKCFPHYALIIIIILKNFVYQACLTIIRRNLLQFYVCIVCVAGGLMVVSFSKKHCGFILNSLVIRFKDKLFLLLTLVP